MRKAIFAVLVFVVTSPSALSAAPLDVTVPIRQFIDGFNTGDTKSAFAAYATGEITIVDEFAPYRWVGVHAAHDWAAEYDRHAKATGVSDGFVKYGAPTRSEIEGNAAYVVVPTTYLYKQHGKAMVEEGQITLVLHTEAGGWKIRSWAWTGVNPHQAK